MLGLPSIAMVAFGLAALVTRHWRHKIERARRNTISPNHVHLALDPVRWGDQGEVARAKHTHPDFRESGRGNRWCGVAAVDLLNAGEQSDAQFVSVNCGREDSAVRAAQRRQAFKVISSA